MTTSDGIDVVLTHVAGRNNPKISGLSVAELDADRDDDQHGESRPPPAPTTTLAPITTTTTITTTCDPITITTGGTYSGCYESTSPSTPAVRIQTTAAVTLDHATIRHAGIGIQGTVNGINLTVRHSKLTALNTGGTFDQRALRVASPSTVVLEQNDLIDGHGVIIDGGTPSVVRVRYNDVVNVGRYPHPMVNGNCSSSSSSSAPSPRPVSRSPGTASVMTTGCRTSRTT